MTPKTVAIVGNSSCLLGSRLGSKIDAHDLVIRMNLFRIYPFQADVGIRTDIVVLVQNPVCQQAAEQGHLPEQVETCREIWFSRPLGDRPDIDDQTHRIVAALPCGLPDCVFPGSAALREVRDRLTIQTVSRPDGRQDRIKAYPSSGLVAVLLATARWPEAVLGLAGFGEIGNPTPGEHYYPDRYKGEWIHDEAGEKQILHELIAAGRARWIYET